MNDLRTIRAGNASIYDTWDPNQACTSPTGKVVNTHRPLSSSFLGLPCRILNINHKKELFRSLWVMKVQVHDLPLALTDTRERSGRVRPFGRLPHTDGARGPQGDKDVVCRMRSHLSCWQAAVRSRLESQILGIGLRLLLTHNPKIPTAIITPP